MLTLHLPLRGEGCEIVVNGERREWHVGVPSVMDTTFLHETRSWGGEDFEMLLLVDFWHPALTEEEVRAMETFWRAARRRVGLNAG